MFRTLPTNGRCHRRNWRPWRPISTFTNAGETPRYSFDDLCCAADGFTSRSAGFDACAWMPIHWTLKNRGRWSHLAEAPLETSRDCLVVKLDLPAPTSSTGGQVAGWGVFGFSHSAHEPETRRLMGRRDPPPGLKNQGTHRADGYGHLARRGASASFLAWTGCGSRRILEASARRSQLKHGAAFLGWRGATQPNDGGSH